MKKTATSPREKCALCLRTTRLVNSHIVPEFLYKALYDSRHRARAIDVISGEVGYLQKGLREPLLCSDCEQLLNDRYEKPFLAAWRTSIFRPARVPAGPLHVVEGLDYAATKLFLLSVLWRASESTLFEFRFADLDCHAEPVRRAILEGSLPPRDPYPIVGSYVVGAKGEVLACVVPPVPLRIDGHRAFAFVLDGLEWMFFVSSHRAHLAEEWGLQPDGTCVLGSLPLADCWSARGVRVGRRSPGPPRQRRQ